MFFFLNFGFPNNIFSEVLYLWLFIIFHYFRVMKKKRAGSPLDTEKEATICFDHKEVGAGKGSSMNVKKEQEKQAGAAKKKKKQPGVETQEPSMQQGEKQERKKKKKNEAKTKETPQQH
jgi:hypothetical protein